MSADRYADLHCHSTCSDGLYSPEELVDLAVERGFKGFSITDHDTIAAYPDALAAAARRDIKLLPGVEFSTSCEGVNVHVLGYAFPLPNPVIESFCRKHLERRKERNSRMIALLEKERMPIAVDVPEGKIFGRVHIALAMLKRGYVGSVDEAFKRYIGDGRKCYSPLQASSVEETIETIRSAGGLAILAHPHLITPPRVADIVMNKDFDGLEGYYASLPFEEENYWVSVAEERGWIVTGGSDFHSEKIKPKNFFGSSWVGKETFDILYNHFLEKMPHR